MRTLAILSAIVLLAAPGLAQAQDRRGRGDDDDDRGRRAVAGRVYVDSERGSGGGGGRGSRDRGGRDDDDGNRGRGRGRGGDDGQRGRGRGDDGAEIRRVPLRQVLPQIQRRTPGRILDSFPETGPGGRPYYRVRWQSDTGERIDYIVDAQTGAILRRE